MDLPPEIQPAWFAKFAMQQDQLSVEIHSMRKEITQLSTQLSDITKTAEFALEKAESADRRAKVAEETAQEIRQENFQLRESLNGLEKKVSNLELQARRENLIFYGIQEKKENETWRDCEDAVCTILKEQMEIEGVQFERVHRLGIKSKNSKSPRPIVAKFSYYKAREHVWQNRHKLADTNYSVMEDYPQEIIEEEETTPSSI